MYDVSDADVFQEDGGAYAAWHGRDATVCLARMSLAKDDVNSQEWDGLSDEELRTLADWLEYFDAKYRRVGTLEEYKECKER